MFRIVSIGKSDRGLQRANNEDAFVVRADLGLCVLADGMGGAAAGEVASRIFVETAVDVFSGSNGSTEIKSQELVQNAFLLAQKKILNHVKAHPEHRGMGCTAELLAFHQEGYVLGHVGDSRSYIFRKGQLKQLTRDHSIVQDEIDRGLITVSEARKHPLRNVILRAVGIDDSLALDLLRGSVMPADLLLLCSDGLTDMIEDTLIQKILSDSRGVEERADRLVDAAKSAGGADNITVVLAEITSA